MTYVTGFLTPVKTEDKARYVKSAEASWPLFQKYGALSQVETWGEDVPDGTRTDFRRAVQATPDETVVFSWIEWPDRATCDAAWADMMADESMGAEMGDMPFDGQRMIFGSFQAIVQA